MSKYVRVKPDLQFPKTIDEVSDYGVGDYAVRFGADFNEDSGTYEVHRLEVIGQGNAPSIDGTVLRGIRVQQALEHLMHNADILLDDGNRYELPYDFRVSIDDGNVVLTPNLRVPVNRDEAEEIRLREAARLYALAKAYSQPVLRLIMNVLSVQQRTASRLVERAREKGLIHA